MYAYTSKINYLIFFFFPLICSSLLFYQKFPLSKYSACGKCWKSQTPTQQQPGEIKSGQAKEIMKVSDTECLWGSSEVHSVWRKDEREDPVYKQVKGGWERKSINLSNLKLQLTSLQREWMLIFPQKEKNIQGNHIQSKSLVRSCFMNFF